MIERERRSRGLLVRGDVLQFGQGLQFGEQLGRQVVEFVEIGILQRVLILRARGAAADGHVLRRLQKQLRAFDLVELRLQAAR